LALFLARSRGRLTLRKLAQRAGMKSEAAVNLAIKRYMRLIEKNSDEAKRLKDCAARLDKIGQMLNV
jgi:hypothetical protein